MEELKEQYKAEEDDNKGCRHESEHAVRAAGKLRVSMRYGKNTGAPAPVLTYLAALAKNAPTLVAPTCKVQRHSRGLLARNPHQSLHMLMRQAASIGVRARIT
eukprot:scaffold213626_cov17-Tisochrysis_lutea.AAC.1